MVKVQLNDSVVLKVEVDLEEMQRAYEEALATNKMLQITSADGTTRAVNPQQVLYFEANGNGEPAGRSDPEDATLAGPR